MPKWEDTPIKNRTGTRWFITSYNSQCKFYGLEFICSTDHNIRLQARVSYSPFSWIDYIHYKRGQATHHDPVLMMPYDFTVWELRDFASTYHHFKIPMKEGATTIWWYTVGRTVGSSPRWSPSISPVFYNQCFNPPPSKLYLENTGNCATATRCYNNAYYGLVFVPPTTFTLSSISVGLTLYKWNGYDLPCAAAKMQLLNNPSCDDPALDVIQESTAPLPSLPWLPVFTFVNFPFTPVELTIGQRYGFLLVGCAPYPTQPVFRLCHGGDPIPGITQESIVWAPYYRPPTIECSWGYESMFKIYEE